MVDSIRNDGEIKSIVPLELVAHFIMHSYSFRPPIFSLILHRFFNHYQHFLCIALIPAVNYATATSDNQ